MGLVSELQAQESLTKLRSGESTLAKEAKRLELKSPGPLRRALMKTLGCTEEKLRDMLAEAQKKKGNKGEKQKE